MAEVMKRRRIKRTSDDLMRITHVLCLYTTTSCLFCYMCICFFFCIRISVYYNYSSLTKLLALGMFLVDRSQNDSCF